MNFNELQQQVQRQKAAEEAVSRYQKEVRILQLQSLAEMVTTREEAQRCLAEAALLQAIL